MNCKGCGREMKSRPGMDGVTYHTCDRCGSWSNDAKKNTARIESFVNRLRAAEQPQGR